MQRNIYINSFELFFLDQNYRPEGALEKKKILIEGFIDEYF